MQNKYGQTVLIATTIMCLSTLLSDAEAGFGHGSAKLAKQAQSNKKAPAKMKTPDFTIPIEKTIHEYFHPSPDGPLDPQTGRRGTWELRPAPHPDHAQITRIVPIILYPHPVPQTPHAPPPQRSAN